MLIKNAIIKTKRLALRPWLEEDVEKFVKLNSDPRVMEYFPSVKNAEQTREEFGRISKHFEMHGWGLWAASLLDSDAKDSFIGFIGLTTVGFQAPFTPAVEIGWRLFHQHWGKGYAPEGAAAALKYAFEVLKLDEVVSFTAVDNRRSRRVMEKIGMVHEHLSDFDHPKLPEAHPLQRHVLYRIKTGYFTKVWETPPADFEPRVEVAACYVEIEGKILLMERSITSAEGKTWGVPAGKMELDETPHEAAMRELFEETSIQATPSQVKKVGQLYVQKPRGSYLYHVFQVHLSALPSVHLSSEHTQYVWADAQTILSLPLVGGGIESLNYYERMKELV